MPSISLREWSGRGRRALDQIEAAHRVVSAAQRGRHHATLQLNYGYAVILSSQFQGFCRGLHSEAVAHLEANTTPVAVGAVLGLVMVQGRKLDGGNPNAGHIGSDFARIGMDLWPEVRALDQRNIGRQKRLETHALWRNAIAHQDWTKVDGSAALTLNTVRSWRSACDGLARSLDEAVRLHLLRLVGTAPW